MEEGRELLGERDVTRMVFLSRVCLRRTLSAARESHSRTALMSVSIPRDVQEFLADYPGQDDDPALTANLEFYQNTRRCRPDNVLIDELHQRCACL
jgi:hypothetical protein